MVYTFFEPRARIFGFRGYFVSLTEDYRLRLSQNEVSPMVSNLRELH